MSCSRRCDEWLATDGKWYLALGDFEYAYDDHECTFYGPFLNREEINAHLRNFSSTGGGCIDDSGTQSPPENAVNPNKTRRSAWPPNFKDFGF